MHHPIISIIIPVYNRENTLARALDSLLSQTYPHWEAIIVDDGSNDKSLSIAHKYSKIDERIYPFSFANKGVALARNEGLIFARGKWITFLDSDDEYLPEHLAIRIHTAQHLKDETVLYGGINVRGDHMVAHEHDHSLLIPVDDLIITGILFMPRSSINLLDGFRNIPYAEDADLFERAKQFYPIQKINSRTYIYHRELPDSITKNLNS